MKEVINQPKLQRVLILIGVLVIAIAVIAVSGHNDNQAQIKKQVTLQKADAKLVEDSLDLYYIKSNSYPANISQLYADKDVKSSINDLPGFNYGVSGDGQSYQIKFTYKDGQQYTHKGEYQKDFHQATL